MGDLIAAVIEHIGAPIGLRALARVSVLIQMRAVEEAQSVLVGGEVGRHPVDEHANARLVAGVDEGHEVVGCAVAARRREEAGDLIAPRAVEGVLGDRHQLDMGEAHLLDVGDEISDQIAVGQPLPAVLQPPRADVEFVDADRLRRRVGLAARGHPLRVIPLVLVDVPHHRGIVRPHLGREANRVALATM